VVICSLLRLQAIRLVMKAMFILIVVMCQYNSFLPIYSAHMSYSNYNFVFCHKYWLLILHMQYIFVDSNVLVNVVLKTLNEGNLKMSAFWDIALYSLGVICTSEMSVYSETTRRYIPEGS
jgi:hypothetical protein